MSYAEEITGLKASMEGLQATVQKGFDGIWKRIDSLTAHCLQCNKNVGEALTEVEKVNSAVKVERERINSHRAMLSLVTLILLGILGFFFTR